MNAENRPQLIPIRRSGIVGEIWNAAKSSLERRRLQKEARRDMPATVVGLFQRRPDDERPHY